MATDAYDLKLTSLRKLTEHSSNCSKQLLSVEGIERP